MFISLRFVLDGGSRLMYDMVMKFIETRRMT